MGYNELASGEFIEAVGTKEFCQKLKDDESPNRVKNIGNSLLQYAQPSESASNTTASHITVAPSSSLSISNACASNLTVAPYSSQSVSTASYLTVAPSQTKTNESCPNCEKIGKMVIFELINKKPH